MFLENVCSGTISNQAEKSIPQFWSTEAQIEKDLSLYHLRLTSGTRTSIMIDEQFVRSHLE